MSESITELGRRLVIGHKRDGRSIFEPQVKRELIEACLHPGVSLAKAARECGVNANQLATWVRERRRAAARAAAAGGDVVAEVTPAFVPVRLEASSAPQPELAMSLQAHLPNGVVVDLRECDVERADKLLQALGRLRCSASTKD